MYIFYFCMVAAFLQMGFSFNEEETDLNLLSSNYDEVDTIGENEENIQSDESGIVVFDTISFAMLEKICKNSNKMVYIIQEDATIDCEAFNMGDQPVEQTLEIIKRSVDLEEGSGMANTEEETTIMPEEKEATTIPEEQEATTIPEEKEATTIPEEQEATIPEEQEATTIPEEQEATTLPEEQEPTTIEETTPEKPPINLRNALLATEEEVNVKNDTEIAETGEIAPTTVSEKDETITTILATTVKEESNDKLQNNVPESGKDVDTTPVILPTIPQVKNEEKPQLELQENKKEKVTTTPTEEKEKPDINTEDKKEEQIDETPIIPAVEMPKEVDNHEPNNDAEVVNKKTVTSLHTNEENKQADSAEPDSGDVARTKESTENTQKAGSKDTTILIVLFVAVVAVGLLAFGYNYVKKRRQQSADLERVERGSSIKRSLQNLTKPEGAEPERKPLIGDVKEVEMVDMKKETPVENSEKPSTEQAVRT